MRPAFRAINPQHCVPTLQDGDFTLWESRAISAYLVRRAGSATFATLLPSDARRRAVVDQRLYFDVATLYQRVRVAFVRIWGVICVCHLTYLIKLTVAIGLSIYWQIYLMA